jgi:hypothetical protein
MDGTRRRVIRAAAALALVAGAGSLRAQDGRTSTVQVAARDWLAIADRGDGGATWDAAGKQFRGAITRERWTEALAGVRNPLGPVATRTVQSTTFRKSVPGAPKGEYVTVLFRTSFANKADGGETVTLEHEPDGQWRVVGYFIQ